MPFRVRVDASDLCHTETNKFWLYVDKCELAKVKDVEVKLKKLLKLPSEAHVRISIDGFDLLSDDAAEILNPDDILKLQICKKKTQNCKSGECSEDVRLNATSDQAANDELNESELPNVEKLNSSRKKHKKKKKDKEKIKEPEPNFSNLNGGNVVKNSHTKKKSKRLKTQLQNDDNTSEMRENNNQIEINHPTNEVAVCQENTEIETNTNLKKKRKRVRRKKATLKLLSDTSEIKVPYYSAQDNNIEQGTNMEATDSHLNESVNNEALNTSNKPPGHIFFNVSVRNESVINEDLLNSEKQNQPSYNRQSYSYTEQNKFVPEVPPKILVDYSKYPALEGVPRIGDKIAFKILELTDDYSPQVSDYKVGCVISYSGNNVKIKLDQPELKSKQGKFELCYEHDEEENNMEYQQEFDILWNTVIEPKLMTIMRSF